MYCNPNNGTSNKVALQLRTRVLVIYFKKFDWIVKIEIVNILVRFDRPFGEFIFSLEVN
jgi:hypothetical protein